MPPPPPPADGRVLGLRERKKLKTRLLIQEQALRLFRDQGYERTTVEQIAEAAEVSPSTFFRYFPTKEDVVMFDALDPLIIEAFRRQPPELSPLAAFRAAFHEVFDGMPPELIDEQNERGRLVYRVPELQGAMVADLLRTATLMQTLLAERVGGDPRDPRLAMFTGAVIGAILAGVATAIEDPRADLIAGIDAALDLLEPIAL